MNNRTKTRAEKRGLRKPELWQPALAALVVVVSVVVAVVPNSDRANSPTRELPAPTAPTLARPAQTLLASRSTTVAKVEDMPFQTETVRTPDPHDGMYNGVTSIGERFHVDAKGRLVQNENTRLHIEALVTLLEPDTLYEVVESEVRHLPPDAAANARELVERHKIYLRDQDNLIPPGSVPLNDDEALAQLDALRDLRIAHFGRQVAEAMYGEEMRNLRALIRPEQDRN